VCASTQALSPSHHSSHLPTYLPTYLRTSPSSSLQLPRTLSSLSCNSEGRRLPNADSQYKRSSAAAAAADVDADAGALACAATAILLAGFVAPGAGGGGGGAAAAAPIAGVCAGAGVSVAAVAAATDAVSRAGSNVDPGSCVDDARQVLPCTAAADSADG